MLHQTPAPLFCLLISTAARASQPAPCGCVTCRELADLSTPPFPTYKIGMAVLTVNPIDLHKHFDFLEFIYKLHINTHGALMNNSQMYTHHWNSRVIQHTCSQLREHEVLFSCSHSHAGNRSSLGSILVHMSHVYVLLFHFFILEIDTSPFHWCTPQISTLAKAGNQ